MSFSHLGLLPALERAILAKAYAAPTPIQQLAIPAILAGQDVLASAQTGSGKTLAFGLPLLQITELHSQHSQGLSGKKAPICLILTPTRELCVQVGQILQTYAQALASRPKVVMLFGGVSLNPQMMGLRGGADIVVATPGRLLDLIDHNALSLAQVRSVVLDEADQLLSLGFAQELARVLALLPAQRQSLLFSATFAAPVLVLAQQMLRDPLRLEVAPTPHTQLAITQRAIQVDAPRRTQLLRHLVEQQQWSRVLVFVATKFLAEIVADKLRKANIHAEPFHGELSQGKRMQVLADFKAQRIHVVVATDMAARGLDIAQLHVVVNYDLPRSATDYIHRIGRTARAGESGLAVSFVSAQTEAHFALIEKRQAQQVAREQVAGFEPMDTTPVPVGLDAQGGVKGKRPSKKDKLRALALSTNGSTPTA